MTPADPNASEPSQPDVTELLRQWSLGDRSAGEGLMAAVYDELHRQASRAMGRENPEHTLQATALVSEAYLRLIDQRRVQWRNRAHFFGVAAQIMRRILVDFARRRPRVDKDVEAIRMSLDAALTISSEREPDLLALDEALKNLATIDERKSRIVELRFFGGLSVEETAEVMHMSTITIIREWNKAKAWLYRELSNN